MLSFIYLSILMILLPNTAQAYIDPGMAGYTMQVIIGGIAAVLFALKSYWGRLRVLFRRKENPSTPEQEREKKNDTAD